MPSSSQPSSESLAQLPGLSPDHLSQLQQCGITTIKKLHGQTQNPHQRQQLAAQLQLHQQYIQKWAALAELSLIPGVGTQNCGLLLHAGVGSTAQLAKMPAERLHRQLLRLHVALLGQNALCPSVAEITQWIFQARRLTRS